MKVFLALVLGIIIGAAALWFYDTNRGKSAMRATGERIENAAISARDVVQAKLHVLDLRPNDIKDELTHSGQVIRRKARETGKFIADATADARITAAIKARLVTSSEISGFGISVNTTGGVVTLSGSVTSTEDIGKAILVAMEADGVREVISTLQVKPRPH